MKRKTTQGQSILRGLRQAIAWGAGDERAARVVHVPAAVDVKAVRARVGLSQGEFADRYGFSRRTLQEWEQGRAQPESAVRAYLTVIEFNSKAVERALQALRQRSSKPAELPLSRVPSAGRASRSA